MNPEDWNVSYAGGRIRSRTEFNQTLDVLVSMYKALESLHHDYHGGTHIQYGLIGQGPMEKIRRAEADLGAYLDRKRLERILDSPGDGYQYLTHPRPAQDESNA